MKVSEDMKMLRRQLREDLEKTIFTVKMFFIPVPTVQCGCGKTIFFRVFNKKVTCGRCGSVWKMKTEIAQVKKGQ